MSTSNVTPSNYQPAIKKRKCPMLRCREMLTFSNMIKCRDCGVDHCLKHWFGPDCTCTCPNKPEPAFQFMNFMNKSRKGEPRKAVSAAPSWSNSAVWISTAACIEKLHNEPQQEVCPHSRMRFLNVGALVEHVEGVHERNGVLKVTLDVCPKCNKGFKDSVALADHRGV